MYMGALCSGILESLADVEKAAMAALSAPPQRKVWPAIHRLLRLQNRKKVEDPEEPSTARSSEKKKVLQKTWLDMLSATNDAFQKGEGWTFLPSKPSSLKSHFPQYSTKVKPWGTEQLSQGVNKLISLRMYQETLKTSKSGGL